jgi:hypothetical protein
MTNNLNEWSMNLKNYEGGYVKEIGMNITVEQDHRIRSHGRRIGDYDKPRSRLVLATRWLVLAGIVVTLSVLFWGK